MGIHINSVYLCCHVPIYRARFAVFLFIENKRGERIKKFISGFMNWNEAWDFCQVIFRLDPKYKFQIISCKTFFDRDTLVPSKPLK